MKHLLIETQQALHKTTTAANKITSAARPAESYHDGLVGRVLAGEQPE
jgi:hypothetical protein